MDFLPLAILRIMNNPLTKLKTEKWGKLMYANEILFVDKFLSKLRMLEVNSIPYRTDDFRTGVSSMKHYYEEHEDELAENLSDIGLLFLNGGQKDFADAIMAVNGGRISLQNPRLEKATIQMTTKRAQLALNNNILDIPDTFITEITQAFCDGAGVQLA